MGQGNVVQSNYRGKGDEDTFSNLSNMNLIRKYHCRVEDCLITREHEVISFNTIPSTVCNYSFFTPYIAVVKLKCPTKNEMFCANEMSKPEQFTLSLMNRMYRLGGGALFKSSRRSVFKVGFRG